MNKKNKTLLSSAIIKDTEKETLNSLVNDPNTILEESVSVIEGRRLLYILYGFDIIFSTILLFFDFVVLGTGSIQIIIFLILLISIRIAIYSLFLSPSPIKKRNLRSVLIVFGIFSFVFFGIFIINSLDSLHTLPINSYNGAFRKSFQDTRVLFSCSYLLLETAYLLFSKKIRAYINYKLVIPDNH